MVLSFNSFTVQLSRKLSEGAYGYIYEAIDINNPSKLFAVKQMRAVNKEVVETIKTEVKTMSKLSSNINIIHLYDTTIVHRNEYYLLIELCKGSLFDLLRLYGKYPMSKKFIIKTIGQVSNAIAYMHAQDPPIIHRDIKAENILLSQEGTLKLCDFGSCTTKMHEPNDTWTMGLRETIQEEIFKNTTPMYRAPEMLELYNNQVICEKVDIWALGCVMYLLIYGVHPFESGEKLVIMNIKPQTRKSVVVDEQIYNEFMQIIREIFIIDPLKRPSAAMIREEYMCNLARQYHVKIDSAIVPATFSFPIESNSVEPSDDIQKITEATKEMFASVKNKAGGFFSNLKVASDKMKISIQSSAKDIKEKVIKKLNIENDNDINPSLMNSSQVSTNVSLNNYRKNSFRKDKSRIDNLKVNVSRLNDFKNENSKLEESVICKQISYDELHLMFYFTRRIVIFSKECDNEKFVSSINQLSFDKEFLLISFYEKRPAYFSSAPCQILEIPLSDDEIIPLKEFYRAILTITLFLKSKDDTKIAILPSTNPFAVGYVVCALLILAGACDTAKQAISYYIKKCRSSNLYMPLVPPLNSIDRYLSHLSKIIKRESDLPKLSSIHVKYAILSLSPECNFDTSKYNLVLRGYCHNLLSFVCDTYQISEKNEVMFYLGATLIGDVRLVFSLVNSAHKNSIQSDLSVHNNVFEVDFHTSFYSGSSTDINFDIGQLDASHYEYINGVSMWKLKLDLFPVPVLEQKALLQEDFSPIFSVGSNFIISTREDLSTYTDMKSTVLPSYKITLQSYYKQFLLNNEMYLHNSSTLPQSEILECMKTNSVEIENVLRSSPEEEFKIYDDVSQYNQATDNLDEFFKNNNVSEVSEKKSDGKLLLDIADNDDTNKNELSDIFDFNFSSTAEILENNFSNILNEQNGNIQNNVMNISSNTVQTQFNNFSENDQAKPVTTKSFLSLNHAITSNNDMNISNTTSNNFNNVSIPFGASNQSNTLGSGIDFNIPYNNSSQNYHSSEKVYSRSTGNLSNQNNSDSNSNFMQFNKYNNVNMSTINEASNKKQSNDSNNTSFFEQKSSDNTKYKFNLFDNNFGSSGYNLGSNQKKSLNDMKFQQQARENMDPIKKKVKDWTVGKHKDIRLLLSTFHEIIWPGEKRWVPITYSQLKEPSQVKLAYRKACLIIHPDKLSGTSNEELAKEIFVEITEAWKKFSETQNRLL